MDIGLIGIDDEGAELSERALFTKTCRELVLPGPSILLTTCQRTELYFPLSLFPEALPQIQHLPLPIYTKAGISAFVHLASVTAGLKSAALGESDIQRQVKLAYTAAAQQQPLSSALHFLFQKSLKVGKGVRSACAINEAPHSLERVIYEKASEHISCLQKAPLLFVGNSVTNRKLITYFQQRGAENITLCTRTESAASGFCRARRIHLIRWEQLTSPDTFAGVVVATHAAPLHLETSRPPFLCDLSVPRCLQSPFAYDMDQITTLLRQKESMRPQKLQETLAFVVAEVDKQFEIYHSKKKRVGVCA